MHRFFNKKYIKVVKKGESGIVVFHYLQLSNLFVRREVKNELICDKLIN